MHPILNAVHLAAMVAKVVPIPIVSAAGTAADAAFHLLSPAQKRQALARPDTKKISGVMNRKAKRA